MEEVVQMTEAVRGPPYRARAMRAATEPVRSTFDPVLRSLCEAIPAPHALFDPRDGALIFANAAFGEEFGALQSRALFERRFEPINAAAGGNEGEADDRSRVEVFARDTGRWYVFHWTSVVRPDGSELLLLSVQNLTERVDHARAQRALQEQLLCSSRVMSVGEMATALAHEINQPLATIINCLTAARTLLERRGVSQQRFRQAIDLARDQAEQAAAVIARIREFVRRREPRREVLHLRTLIEHVVQLQRFDAQKSRVQIHESVAEDVPAVLGDRVMIEQVLTNLVRNAIEALVAVHPAERVLRIEARRDLEGRAQIRVVDSGPGVSSTDEPLLFTPFFTTKPNGMGIGLTICRTIAEFHEGHLYYDRVAAEDGTQPSGSAFVFVLPATSAA